ncbi:alanyl-tRNA editing protein [Streptomyces sp. Ru73]|uniref:alanine--tRNA ligase-related protein n=1 Tax=Streptomyces sp. Ru73 TaxID=2080748 RepID=UPI000CDDF64C|nr:alanyl-tRNA editing protein [Streptomyces sp. Ru73]POX37632.1 alanyl-tRNA editing protein [Streptomyces sp. Ru73]
MIEAALWSSCPPTQALYHDDPYATTATATVLSVSDRYAVFDRSVFYAESGGQVADQGTVDGARVVDVQKAGGRPFQLPNGEVATVESVFCHEFAEPCTLRPGDQVTMEIDWDRRFRNMQMHTLAHFLFHATGEYLEAQGQTRSTRGCHISDDSARFDFGCAIPGEAAAVIEARVRELLASSPEATVTPLPDTHDVFVWRSGDIVIPCGGTHVHHPKEIQGSVKVRRRTKGRHGTRLYIDLDRAGTD